MTEPELTLEQQAYRTRISYRFFGEHVEYTIVDSRGDKASFSVKYEDLPARFDYRTFQPRNAVISTQLFALMAVTLVLILLYPHRSLVVIASMLVYGALFVGISSFVRHKWFTKLYTAVPTRNGKLLVLRSDRHEEVLRELESRRMRALRKYAMIDALNAPAAEMRRLRWLMEEGVITREEFDSYRRALGPAVGHGPFPGPEEGGTPLVLKQDTFHFHSEFSFHDSYLEYRLDDGALTTFNVRYNDLPPPTDYRISTRRDGIAGLVLCMGMLLALALMDLAPSDHYFETSEGLHALAIGALTYLPALALLVWGAARVSRKEFTSVPVAPGAIRILHDAQRDRIVGEIQNRRHEALRALAVIDSLNPPQRELRKFSWLKEQGAITEQEYESFRQKLLEAIATRPENPPPNKPPRETLH